MSRLHDNSVLDTLLSFPVEALELSDYDLGGLLLGVYIAACAEPHGLLPDIPEDFAVSVVSQVKKTEASPENAAVEKALHKAADGEFKVAGRTIRYYLENNAHHMAAVRIAKEEREKRLKGPRKGGEARKIAVAAENLERDNKIFAQYYQLIGSGKNSRDIPTILAKRYGLSTTRIRQILKEKRKPA